MEGSFVGVLWHAVADAATMHKIIINRVYYKIPGSLLPSPSPTLEQPTAAISGRPANARETRDPPRPSPYWQLPLLFPLEIYYMYYIFFEFRCCSGQNFQQFALGVRVQATSNLLKFNLDVYYADWFTKPTHPFLILEQWSYSKSDFWDFSIYLQLQTVFSNLVEIQTSVSH